MARWPFALPLALLAVVAGCAELPKSASLLSSAPTADHVALELFFVRVPLSDAARLAPLWSSIDEQAISLEVRGRLAANGFIVGQLGGQLPPVLTDLLQISDDAPTPIINQPSVIDPTKPPLVHRKRLDIYQIETPSRIVVTGERERHARLNVLLRDQEDGQVAVRGWTFKNAKGSLVTKVHPQADGRVKLDIVPEVDHGEAHREISPSEGGTWTMQLAPPRHTFDRLRLSATLLPGEALLFSCLGDRPGSLGHQFFTERQSDQLHQVMLLIRVVQTQADDLFSEKPLKGE